MLPLLTGEVPCRERGVDRHTAHCCYSAAGVWVGGKMKKMLRHSSK